jgi:uncharacterized membrane protein YgcG
MSRLQMRIARLLLGAVLGGFAVAGSAAADERIVSYDSTIRIEADGMLEVTEQITVRAEGERINRGIYRDFPTRYQDRYGNRVVVDFQMLGVERNGAEEPWFTERRRNGVRINTGDDTAIERPAVHRYTLRYRTSRQIGFFADHDELYWNAIGTGWAFPIDAGSVEVTLPQPVPVAALAAEGYTGPQGAKGQAYAATLPAPGRAQWRLTAPLAPGEGLTIVLSFPKGVLAEPTTGQRWVWFFSDNRALLLALAGLAILLIGCFLRWHRVGRDPPAGVIIPRYEPPAGHSPAALRFMRRTSYDTRCFSAGVLALGVAGRLRIDHDAAKEAEQPWTLTRTGDAGPILPEDEAALLDGLFAGGERLLLDHTQAETLRKAQSAQQGVLERTFHPAYFARHLGSTVTAFVFALAVTIAALVLARNGGGGMPLVLATGLAMIVVAIVFGFLVQAPTVQGRRLLDEIEGFRRYLGVAERTELGGLRGPEPAIDAAHYERLLPYAVALDVEEAWTRRFTAAVGSAAAAAATAGIAWYHGGHTLDPAQLTRAVGSGLSATIASASTPPGSGSGAGGGGFSGGGGGGGGGGGR